jgi:DNA-directed RNA polymerase specialized sigma24 family protein
MKSKPFSDEEIIIGILNDDKKVLLFLYQHNFEILNVKICSEGGTRKDTEDIFHDALLILFQKIRQTDFQLTSSLHTFLQAIARNLWKRKVASNAALFNQKESNLSELLDETNDEEYVYIERRKLYLKHLADLPKDCIRMIKLVIEGFSIPEIMNRVKYNSIEFTKTKRFRCKAMLYKKIINDPSYKELKDERFRTTGSIPRW